MASPCNYREPSWYKEQLFKLMPDIGILSDDEINDIITKKNDLLNKIASEIDGGLFGVDYDEVGKKALMYGYKAKFTKVLNGNKTFIPADIDAQLDKELFGMRLTQKNVSEWCKKIKHNLVIEKLIDKGDEKPTNTQPKQTTSQKDAKFETGDILTSDKIASTEIYSNFDTAGEIFKNEITSVDEIIKKDGLEAIIVYTTEKSEIDRIMGLYENIYYETDPKDKPIIRINPSNDEVKRVVGNHNKIGVIKGNNNPGRRIDNLYRNVRIEQTSGSNNSKDFIENIDMNLFQHKINDLYVRNNEQGLRKDAVMRRVLIDLREEYDKMSEEEQKKYKGKMYKKLIDNFDYISSLVTVNEEYDEGRDLEEYDAESEDDPLYSEQHSSSNMPKDKILVGLLSSIPTNKEDALGTPIYYEPGVINNILIEAISGSEDSDEMVARLTDPKNVAKHPWFTKIAENIEKDGSKRLKSILFTKYANLYKSNYISISGHRTIDEGTSYATTSINLGYVSDETKARFNNVSLIGIDEVIKGLKTINSIADLDQNRVEAGRQAGMTDEEIWQRSAREGFNLTSNTGYDVDNNKLRSFLGYIGIETDPEEHDFGRLSREEISEIKENLAEIYYLALRDYGEIVSPQKLMKDYKQKYENILNLLNSITQQKTESIVRTAGESKFVYADKNYVDKLVDGIHKNREEFMQNEFLKYDLFTSNAGQEYEKAANGLHSSLLQELALSPKTDWFRVQSFFVAKDKDQASKKYGDLSPEELHEINRKIFYKEEIQNRSAVKQGRKEYVFVHSPIYADKGQLHYYRVPKISLIAKMGIPTESKDLENSVMQLQEPEFLTDIKKLIYFETNRIRTAKERAVQIKAGKLEPIDVYDTVNGKKGRAETYCFQPMLNEYGEKENEDGTKSKVSLYDMLADIDNNTKISESEREKQKDDLIHNAAVDILRNIFWADAKDVQKITKTKKLSDGTVQQVEEHPFKSMLAALRNKDYDKWNKQIAYFKKKDLVYDNNSNFKGYASDMAETDFTKIEYAINSYIRQADIKQLTISDEAFYKNDVDVQKRYAQVQAGYQRPDTKSTHGREWMRTLYLKDSMFALSKEELNSMRAFLTEAKEKLGLNIDVDSIVNAFGTDSKGRGQINVADAQCYRTLSSYRSVRDMFGLWSTNDEALYNKIRNNEPLTIDDYNQVWQTLKPFVYTQQDVEWKDASGNVRHNKVGYQYKNSENVLFNMYMLFSKDKNKLTKLGELNRFMEQYEIDTVQFESAVKVGREGLIDLNDVEPDKVFDYLVDRTGVEREQEQKCKSGKGGNPHIVHEIPYKEYGIKTSTPPHMFDTEQQLGSQVKKLLQGDIPDDAKIYLDMKGIFTKDGAKLVSNEDFKIQLFGDDIILKVEEDRIYLDKENYLKLLNGLMSDIMLDGFTEVQEIFGNKEKLSGALQELMAGSPKYDFDIKQALKIGKDGKFMVDPKSPAIKDKITVLMTSILKNRINKQLTRGGTAIQMACWGGEDVMHEDGTFGPLKIVKNPDGTIKYMECLMPAYSRQFIESMMNKDGVLDTSKCKDDNLLKALCYRVPTEDIYSMIPLKVVGFTPLQFGTNIMLPREITTLTGSDFDVDKMYLFLPEFKMKSKWREKLSISKEDFRKFINERISNGEKISKENNAIGLYKKHIQKEIYNKAKERSNKENISLQDAYNQEKQIYFRNQAFKKYKETDEYKLYAKYEANKRIESDRGRRELLDLNPITEEDIKQIEQSVINEYFNAWAIENGYKSQEPEYVKFDLSKDISENNGEAKRNLLLSLMRGAISSPYNLTKEQNPGGFDYLKELANKINPEVEKPMNLTESQYLNFFNLNMTGKKLIGIYANHNVAHALCQGSGLGLNYPIHVNGADYSSLSGIYDNSKRRISRNIAEFLAASVDNAKDPVLAKLWQNDHTASTTCFLLRLGVTPNDVVKMFRDFKKASPEQFDNFMKYGPKSFKKVANQYKTEQDIWKQFDKATNKDKLQVENFYAFLGYYSDTIQNLETINLMLKADSTNGAMYDLADIVDKTIKQQNLRDDKNLVGVSNVLPEYEEDVDILSRSKKEIYDKLKEYDNIKSYKLAYYLTYCNFRQYFGDVIDKTILDNAIVFGKQLQMFTSDNIKKYITEYTKEQLRYLDYFKPKLIKQDDGTYKVIPTSEIIKQTLTEIPQKIAYYKKTYPDNMFIKMLTLAENNDGTQYLMINNIADMRFETVNDVKAAFNDLYNDPFSMQDAIDLIHYTLCVNGFGYDPRSFISMIPIKTLAQQDGMENLYQYFEIDNIEDFEDRFILENNLVEKVSTKQLGFEKKNQIQDELVLSKSNVHSKIIKLEGSEKYPDRYWRKVYEDERCNFYQEINVVEDNNGNLSVEHKNEQKYGTQLQKLLDENIISANTENKKELLSSMVESVVKTFQEEGIDVSNIDKDAVIEVLSDTTKMGRYFNLNADPMSVYDPIAIDFC